MSPPRFWTPSGLVPGPHRLEGTEAHHLAHVLRLGAGDAVELFDGRGGVATATVAAGSKRTVDLLVTDVRRDAAPSPQIVLAVAPPKGERFDWLVEKAAELGVDILIPLLTERGTVDPRDSKLDRLRQVVIAACKQSRCNWAMEIAPPRRWSEFLQTHPTGSTLFLTDPEGSPVPTLRPAKLSPASIWTFAIGPEGGWTTAELAAGQAAGCQRLSLGATVLRIETAAVVCATLGRLWRDAAGQCG
jgi:16S rRNA (uracil1498-N3)-methyltransferase